MNSYTSLADQAVAADQVGLLEGLASTRAIRRYRDEPIPDEVLRDILFAATRGPSGSNRQPFRFLVLSQSDTAQQAKEIIAASARRVWTRKRDNDGYDKGTGADPNSPKARMGRVMQHYVDNFHKVPCLILPCMIRYRAPTPMEGASIYPAVQNLLLAARALGYGGVITGFHGPVDEQLRSLLNIPQEIFIACTVTLGKPQGGHGPVRRRPMSELVFADQWEQTAPWAIDPPGTQYTKAGPPPGVKVV